MVRVLRWLVLLALLSVAALFRLWQIDHIPPGFHFDESFEGLEAWRILTDSSYRPIFLTGNFGVPPLNSYANALMFALFRWFGGDVGPTAMRVTAACFGLLGVLTTYALAWEMTRFQGNPVGEFVGAGFPPKGHPAQLWGPKDRAVWKPAPTFPLLAAVSLALMRWHVHFSRMGIEPVIVPLLWLAANWLLLRGWRTGGWLNFVGCGVMLAAAMYTYQGAWIIPLLMIPVSIHLLAQSATPDLRQRMTGLFLAALVALLLVAPLVWFFATHWELLLLRPTQIAVTGGAADGRTTWGEIAATARMFVPFGATGDLDPRRNLPGLPALDLWLAIPFFMGLLIALWRIRQPMMTLLLIGLLGLLLPGVLSEYAPHFHRILGASAPVALLCGLGFTWLWQLGESLTTSRLSLTSYLFKSLARLIVIALLLATSLTTWRNYFDKWAQLPDLYYAFDVGLWEIGQWMATQPAERPLYLSPRTADHPTLAFALQTRPTPHSIPVTFDGRAIFPLTDPPSRQPEVYVTITHEDFRSKLLLPGLFPDANQVFTWLDRTNTEYAQAWNRSSGSQAQRPPQQPWRSEVGDGISLVGYDVQPATLKRGEILYLQLHWLVSAPPTGDWTVFTHLIDPATADGTPLTGKDSPPGNGTLPTTRWQSGWRILDEYQLPLPVELSAGRYRLRIGLYQNTGERLPPNGIDLGEVQVE